MSKSPLKPTHTTGLVLKDRGDGLHWLQCCDCGGYWAENDNGTIKRGSKFCRVNKLPLEEK